jgi:cytoskeletal protein CcmA (bactofilin family)
MSKNNAASMTFISDGTRITGDIAIDHDLRVEGFLKGTVSVGGTLVLGPTGKIEGDVVARAATLAGHLAGNIKTHEKLVLETKSVLLGDLQTRELIINEGAMFQGKCSMDHGEKPLQQPSTKASLV